MQVDMKLEEALPQIFEIKRLLPQVKDIHTNAPYKIPSRSYQTTNDDQRFWFIYKVINKDLSIREVRKKRRNW